MKALESAPERYDKGISWLGWGKLGDIRKHIVDLIEAEGNRVLEIGVGTGTQTLQTLFSWNQKTSPPESLSKNIKKLNKN